MHATTHWGCTDTVRESGTESRLWEKNHLLHRDSNPRQYCAWLFSPTELFRPSGNREVSRCCLGLRWGGGGRGEEGHKKNNGRWYRISGASSCPSSRAVVLCPVRFSHSKGGQSMTGRSLETGPAAQWSRVGVTASRC